MFPNKNYRFTFTYCLAISIVVLAGCATGLGPVVEDPNTIANSRTAQVKADTDIPGSQFLDACPWEADDLAQTMVTLLNQTRSESRMCGQTTYEAAAPLSLNDKLSLAAARHSADMANNNFFRHEGSDGLKADTRANNAGYQWFSVAENIAGGQTEMVTVIRDWLDSDKHCLNLMRPELTEAGVGCFKNDNSELKIYWTLVLARPLLE